MTVLATSARTAHTADAPSDTAQPDADAARAASACRRWFDRVAKTQAEQPHWITPLVTVTPRLEQEYRYDQLWQQSPNGTTTTSFGGGKGLELIPAERIEVIVGEPAWLAHSRPPGTDGWGDESLLLKYRLLAANEDHGNYIVTTFLGLSLPTGSDGNTTDHTILTPTLAWGKGWGDFDLQNTVAVALPDNGVTRSGLGTPVLANLALQYHLGRVLWPELELNYTYWPNGAHTGKNQVFVTPGVVVGRFPIWRRLAMVVGAGYQMAVTARPLYDHAVILSGRLPF